MAIIRGTGSNSLTNKSTCGGNIKGGLAPNVNNSANVNRILGKNSISTATGSLKDIPETCVSGTKYFPKYCCPVGVGQIYHRIGMGKYNI